MVRGVPFTVRHSEGRRPHGHRPSSSLMLRLSYRPQTGQGEAPARA